MLSNDIVQIGSGRSIQYALRDGSWLSTLYPFIA